MGKSVAVRGGSRAAAEPSEAVLGLRLSRQQPSEDGGLKGAQKVLVASGDDPNLGAWDLYTRTDEKGQNCLAITLAHENGSYGEGCGIPVDLSVRSINATKGTLLVGEVATDAAAVKVSAAGDRDVVIVTKRGADGTQYFTYSADHALADVQVATLSAGGKTLTTEAVPTTP